MVWTTLDNWDGIPRCGKCGREIPEGTCLCWGPEDKTLDFPCSDTFRRGYEAMIGIESPPRRRDELLDEIDLQHAEATEHHPRWLRDRAEKLEKPNWVKLLFDEISELKNTTRVLEQQVYTLNRKDKDTHDYF